MPSGLSLGSSAHLHDPFPSSLHSHTLSPCGCASVCLHMLFPLSGMSFHLPTLLSFLLKFYAVVVVQPEHSPPGLIFDTRRRDHSLLGAP